ncbi:MAG: helix-turn-helix domain-containing protein, partial [Trebonia sp.]
FWLRDLRRRSGLTYDQLGKNAHYATSTVQAATAGQRLPTLRVTMAFVKACGGDADPWREYWTQIRRAMDRGAPAGAGRSIEPPWARGVATTTLPLPEPARSDLPAEPAGDGWFFESFSALLRLEADPVEAIEFRRVVATEDGLAELVTSLSVPRAPDDSGGNHDLESELLYGGCLERRLQPYDSFFQNVIVLPRPLNNGDRHEYAIRHRIPAGQSMTFHYAHVPYRRSDRFDLRVRFGADRVPSEVWALRDAPTAVIYARQPTAEILVPDGFGELQVSFERLRPGLGYGISWR